MARLPQPGGDQGQWGQILNEYLSQVHNTDGSLKDNIITEAQLATPVADKLNIVAGQQGATGPIGPAGPAGAVGATGPQGTQGTAGVAGSQGATGPAGSAGAAGPQGATGPVGPAGAAGATGPQGIQGTVGAAGPQGATGPAGQDGTSVTIAGNVATAASLPTLTVGDAGDGYLTNDDGHLHVWSGSAWTDVGAVRGPDGPAGATGPQGIQGTAGVAGPAGATGPVGSDGAAGPQGATGPAGATTIAGITGLQAALDSKSDTSHVHALDSLSDVSTSGASNGYALIYNGSSWAPSAVSAGASTTVVARSTTYTAVAGDYVLADATAGGFSITLPSPVNGRRVSVKKIDASLNAITVVGTVDNVVNPAINEQWAGQDFLSDGTQWYFV